MLTDRHRDRLDPFTLVDRCRDLARTRAGERAFTWLRDGEEEELFLTFAQLDERARSIAANLEARGLNGERALLVYPPGLEFIAAFLGCLYAGVVAVPMGAPHGARSTRTLLGIAQHAGPAIVLSHSSLGEELTSQPRAFGSIPLLLTDQLPREAAQGWRPGPSAPDGLAFIQYTSGSTGSPKGVELSHRNLIRNEQMIQAAFAHDERTVFVGWLPLFHDMGLVGNVLQPLFLGVHSVLMAPAAFVQKPLRWLRAITRYRATTSGSPNFGYELCAQKVRATDLTELDLASWKVAYNGSEPVRAETLERFAERFAICGFRRTAFYPCYGLAEASLFVTGGTAGEAFVDCSLESEALESNRVVPLPAGHPRSRRLVSCGRPWLDQRVRVVDPESRRALREDQVGEIWIQGSNVARGYRGQPRDDEDPFRSFLASGEGPFLRTGDLGFQRAGQLFVTGRLKDVLILKGRNHYPQDIELTVARSHRALRVDHGAAFTHEDAGEERLLVVQEVRRGQCEALESGGAAAAQVRAELVGAVRQAVAREHGLSVWKVILIEHGSLPKTSSGKVQRRECRSLWRRAELTELGPVAAVAQLQRES